MARRYDHMINEEGIYILATLAAQTAIDDFVDAQTALQILVRKNICTIDEINTIRNEVKKKSKAVRQMQETLNLYIKKTEDEIAVQDLLNKAINHPTELTPEERKLALEYLENIGRVNM